MPDQTEQGPTSVVGISASGRRRHRDSGLALLSHALPVATRAAPTNATIKVS
ncbi:hypothetical protein [Actinoplanes sp. N902-109]|uniref:hypothetical protein n=1 Tax=Actinoplanes sp. (strain N902-109) TaxID=649831 RepID=UPI0003295FDC|nr:hypothetical protein [Actinoplanes sp. N902-109]AGL17675.1 hypothetical protein L083_4165 [Actinoplanes sp. N902-109]